MKNNRILHALGDVDERFIEEAAPTKKKTIYPWGFALALASSICLILSVMDMLSKTDTPIEPVTSVILEEETIEPVTFPHAQITISEDGVTIPPIDFSEQDFDDKNTPSFFIYKGRCYIYLSSMLIFENDPTENDARILMEHYVGKTTIADIQTFKEQPYKEFTGTVEEELYTVDGIDSSVMLCSLSAISKKNSHKSLHLWLNSNDITLKKGADLYEKILPLQNNYIQFTYMPSYAHYSFSISSANNQLPGPHHIVEHQYHNIVDQFLQALNEGDVVTDIDVIHNEVTNPVGVKKYAVMFQLKNQLCIPLFIYDNGYVRLGAYIGEFSNLLVKVDIGAVQELIELFFNNDTTTITIVD